MTQVDWEKTLLNDRGTDAELARAVHGMFPGRYQYKGENQWMLYRPHKEQWEEDPDGKETWMDVQLNLSQKLLKWAHAWEERRAQCSVREGYDYNRNSNILMNIVLRLQKDKSRIGILEEMKIYFMTQL